MAHKYHQNIALFSGKLEKEKDYWINKLSGNPELSGFPTDNHKSIFSNSTRTLLNYTIREDLYERIVAVSNKSQYGIYAILLSGINYLIYRYTGAEDITIGIPSLTQNELLPFRTKIEVNETFKIYLTRIGQTLGETIKYQNLPIKTIKSILSGDESSKEDIKFKTSVLLQNLHNKEYINNKSMNMSIFFKIREFQIDFDIEYETALFEEYTVKHIYSNFINFLSIVLGDLEIKVKDINILSKYEKEQLLYSFNDTKYEYQIEKTIHEIFQEQAEIMGEKTAVEYEGNTLSYKELNEKSNQLARLLIDMGVKVDNTIGILAERSIEMVIGIIGILKAGGAYLPINPEYPQDRIRYMLEDSCATIVLTQKEISNKLDFDIDKIRIDDADIYVGNKDNIECTSRADNLAYIIYTSGSSGRPKGVQIEHKSLNNFIESLSKKYQPGIGSDDKCLSLTNISFDVSVGEIFLPLLKGAVLVLYSHSKIIDVQQLRKELVQRKITFTYIPPVMLKDLCIELKKEQKHISLNKILVGVEPIMDYVLEEYIKLNENMQIINGYGPTEATICSTLYVYGHVQPTGRKVPIGKPVNNTCIYILGKHGEIQPIGVTGEIYIAGDGIGRGYINKPEFTKDRFVQNQLTFNTEKMYRTGDKARWLPDGNIEFVDRIDQQVKIRGYRIELGEIEHQLIAHTAIKEAVVIVKGSHSEKYLCVYIVAERKMTLAELRAYLTRQLPEYMIPSYFIQLDNIPRTTNGKIDKKSLPEPDGSIVTGITYEAPRSELERELASIWKDVLKVQNVGVNDSFFELGGNSLNATLVAAKIYKTTSRDVSVTDIFNKPTIGVLADYIRETEKKEYLKIEKAELSEYYPASSSQIRMFILNQFEKERPSYNISQIIQIEGSIDYVRLETAFKTLIKRHEILRTSFDIVDGQVVQKIHEDIPFNLEIFNISDKNEHEIIQGCIKPFDLRTIPLLRIGIAKQSECKHILIWEIHHIISDGISMNILLRELISLYDRNEIAEQKLQYKDYAVWQKKLYKSGIINIQKEYWINVFSGEIPLLNMPTDFPRPLMQSFSGDVVTFTIDRNLVHRVKRIAREAGATLYIVLFTVYNILLSKYSGQEDIIVGTPIAGRNHVDIESISGMFVNTLALRNLLKDNKTFREILSEVKNNSLKAYENQDYPFEELIESLNIKKDLSRNPLFDVMFDLQSSHINETISKDFKLSPYRYNFKRAKFDLSLYAIEENEGIAFNFEYCTKLFKKETIERMGVHFINLLDHAINNMDTKLAELEFLTLEEKEKILYKFNDTSVEYSNNKTIQELFEEQEQKTPDNVAIIFKEERVTYRQLNQKANQLARLLIENGITRGDIVGIMVERSCDMLVGIFAVLKAGAAYLPIDTSYPNQRIKYILEDSGVSIVLTQKKLSTLIPKDCGGKGILTIKLDDEKIYRGCAKNLKTTIDTKDLAYIIYTSGSTGKPKAVMIEHISIINTLRFLQRKYPLLESDTYLLKTTYTFDVSVAEIFGWFFGGGRLALIEQGEERDIDKILKAIDKYKVTHINFIPSLLNVIMDTIDHKGVCILKGLKYVFVAGEALMPVLAVKFIKLIEGVRLENLYGPTEASVYGTMYSLGGLEDIHRIPIGKAIQNMKVYILDKNLKIQPIGVCGELYLSGIGLARGYLNRPDLTAEKFIPSIFVEGETMYKTGDLARWLPDGNIEFCGRIDQQVKIRGFRIELGEIENTLLRHMDIKEAIIMVKEDESNDKVLCSYIVSDKKLNASDLKDYLLGELPEYMIPTYFIQMDKMPLNINGKVDTKELTKPNVSFLDDVIYETPENETEQKLIGIFSEILGIDKIGINSSFLALGGHSLKAAILTSKINKEMNIEMPINKVYSTSKIRELAQYIEDKKHLVPNFRNENLILIKSGKYKSANMFLIHDGSGEIASYTEFCNELDYRFNYWGLKAYSQNDNVCKHSSIEEISQNYVEQIKIVQPKGPYFIAGWSIGGTIGFEVARILEESGELVELLAIFDSVPPHICLRDSYGEVNEIDKQHQKLIYYLEDCNSNININYFKSLANENIISIIPKQSFIEKQELLQIVNIIYILDKARANYFPNSKIGTQVYYFKADKTIGIDISIWNTYCKKSLKTFNIDCEHYSMFKHPYVNTLAKYLNTCLKETDFSQY